jgi:hypothetical protein
MVVRMRMRGNKKFKGQKYYYGYILHTAQVINFSSTDSGLDSEFSSPAVPCDTNTT